MKTTPSRASIGLAIGVLAALLTVMTLLMPMAYHNWENDPKAPSIVPMPSFAHTVGGTPAYRPSPSSPYVGTWRLVSSSHGDSSYDDTAVTWVVIRDDGSVGNIYPSGRWDRSTTWKPDGDNIMITIHNPPDVGDEILTGSLSPDHKRLSIDDAMYERWR